MKLQRKLTTDERAELTSALEQKRAVSKRIEETQKELIAVLEKQNAVTKEMTETLKPAASSGDREAVRELIVAERQLEELEGARERAEAAVSAAIEALAPVLRDLRTQLRALALDVYAEVVAEVTKLLRPYYSYEHHAKNAAEATQFAGFAHEVYHAAAGVENSFSEDLLQSETERLAGVAAAALEGGDIVPDCAVAA